MGFGGFRVHGLGTPRIPKPGSGRQDTSPEDDVLLVQGDVLLATWRF